MKKKIWFAVMLTVFALEMLGCSREEQSDIKVTNNIEVTVYESASMNYFVVYNNTEDKFEFCTYGYDFVWKDGDVQTLVYIETTPRGSGVMSHYWMKDYSGNVLYESKEPISGLSYEQDGKLHFLVEMEEGIFTKESIECE